MILLNLIMGFIETVCDKVDIAVKAINNSSVSDILVFRDRNETPWMVKENALPVSKGCHLRYSMTDKKFYEVGGRELLKMDNIIMAELVDASGVGVCDMSEFLHSVKWESFSPPSVYELVLVNLLINGICLSKKFLSECFLNVTTLENPSLTIKLKNPLVRDDFVSWNVFVPLEPVRLNVPVFVTAPAAIREEAVASATASPTLADASASASILADASLADASLST